MGCIIEKGAPSEVADKAEVLNTVSQYEHLRQGAKTILGKYIFSDQRSNIVGEGTSSICYKGIDVTNGQLVAVKVYRKNETGGPKADATTLQKFKRQVAVLKELQKPFVRPSDPTLWHQDLEQIKPSRLFVTLLDHSKDEKGEPGLDAQDGCLYVVTELAQCTLKAMISRRREQSKPLSAEVVKEFTRRIVLVLAGLHAKGFVHLDIKPDNLMMFDGHLKLIDLDGCVQAGSTATIRDSTLSFSPCYCAPEWAQFMTHSEPIEIKPGLDVWSAGMTICELVALTPILKKQYVSCAKNAKSKREAGNKFLKWLSSIEAIQLPEVVEAYDQEFIELLTKWLLVPDQKRRKTLAQSLSAPFVAGVGHNRNNNRHSSFENFQDLPVKQHAKHSIH